MALLGIACLADGCGPPAGDARRETPAGSFDAPPMSTGAAGAALEAPARPPLDVPDAAPLVVFLGDSIGAGLHLAEHQAFPAVLQARLAAEGRPFRLVSSCESGRTTAGGVTALDWVLRAEPDLVVLELGGNDGLRGIPLEEVERNLRETIERARAGGAQVLLLGVRLPPNYGEYGERFDALYPHLARVYGLAFVPFFMEGVGGVPDKNLEDGLHPTAEGQALIAEKVLPALREALAGAATR